MGEEDAIVNKMEIVEFSPEMVASNHYYAQCDVCYTPTRFKVGFELRNGEPNAICKQCLIEAIAKIEAREQEDKQDG